LPFVNRSMTMNQLIELLKIAGFLSLLLSPFVLFIYSLLKSAEQPKHLSE
jgi:hypothetical protein